ncbi:Starvation-sensing protein RspB [Bradyrhizobium sp. ORS 285]|uniref:Zn-dependent oxidoreductase n=1 Tax=Bradyrhizobium sp. ORS 285 TaxID=115808 RepID=UPI0002406191|nr:Zn-dependent oxidoreductase [Bradyrhizobium sp. ORS 285]CCD85443.1 putative dehydrogenase, starvation-sensing protein with NAD(P)-binding and GroES domains [Bradyrhizobium sp. ORS 285]SMX60290.1 Starvation-sensing protein RspB [Bradyrhizobium sp. ORS 285]
MKSLVVERPGRLSIETRATPEPAAGEVRIKVERAGICGSDIHILHGSNPFARYPRVIGHEFFGRIDKLGEGVNARLGARVVVDPVVSCGTCYPCSVGRPNVCAELAVLGVHRDGGFSEYACVPAENAHLLPDSVDDDKAPLVEPFSIAANITDHTRVFASDVALVYGAGPIGLTVIQVLKHVYGVKQLIVTDRIDARLEAARHSGADIVVNTAQSALPAALANAGIRPTLIIDAACHPAILTEAIEIASPAARIGLLGFSAEPSTIVQQKVTAKELAIHASRLNSGKFGKVIDWFACGTLQPERLITHRFDLDAYATAFDTFEHNPTECCKVQLIF